MLLLYWGGACPVCVCEEGDHAHFLTLVSVHSRLRFAKVVRHVWDFRIVTEGGGGWSGPVRGSVL